MSHSEPAISYTYASTSELITIARVPFYVDMINVMLIYVPHS